MGELWALSESPVTVGMKEGKGRAFQGEVSAWAQARCPRSRWNAGTIQGVGEGKEAGR